MTQKLDVNEVQWIEAGAFANSDYSGQVRGQSFIKDLGGVRRCNEVDGEGELDQYGVEKIVSSITYNPAKDIFLDKPETMEGEFGSNRLIDTAMTEIIQGCEYDDVYWQDGFLET
ncbi:hypothetical protein BGX21_010676 [Mortierella sp. AD011]|nr:hypothetical protein BGX20_011098 [Mortierella sp. AD010]KAF9393651.1 hypothetical protein BGX21_010676 [Mortierella sp. AD011]